MINHTGDDTVTATMSRLDWLAVTEALLNHCDVQAELGFEKTSEDAVQLCGRLQVALGWASPRR